MAKFNIIDGSVKLIGTEKVGMMVTFMADSGQEVTQYHEVESTDKDVIEQELQKTANNYSASFAPQVVLPSMETGKDLEVALLETV